MLALYCTTYFRKYPKLMGVSLTWLTLKSTRLATPLTPPESVRF